MYIRNTIQTILVIAIVAFFASCKDKTMNHVTGKVVTKTDTVISIRDTSNNVFTFDVTEAQYLGSPILIDDSVNVYYRGEYEADGKGHASVIELIINLDKPEEHPLAHVWRFEKKTANDTLRGYKLNENGTGEVLNNPQLQLERWEKRGDKLLFKGIKFTKKEAIHFTDTMNIEKLNHDSLVLSMMDKSTGKIIRYRLRRED